MSQYENVHRCSIELYKQRSAEMYKRMLQAFIADIPVSELKKVFPLEVLDPTVRLEDRTLAAKMQALASLREVELTISFKPKYIETSL